MRSTAKAGRPPKISKPKQIIFAAVLVCTSLVLVLTAAGHRVTADFIHFFLKGPF